jgi:hypothetical protein
MIYGEYWKDGDYVFCSQKCRREWQSSEREKKAQEVRDAGFSSETDMDEALRMEPGNSDREKRRNEIQAKINEPQTKDLDNLVADKLNEAKAAGKEFVRAAKGIAGLFRKK